MECGALVGADVVTPVNEAVMGCGLRLLDPSRDVFPEGASEMLRLIVLWGPESALKDVAVLRNQKLSAIVNRRCGCFVFTRASSVFVGVFLFL